MTAAEPYTPSVEEAREFFAQVRGALIDPEAAALAVWRAEMFDRMLAKVRAEALREAAREFAEGEWVHAFFAGNVDDDVSAVQATDKWLIRRADEIEKGAE